MANLKLAQLSDVTPTDVLREIVASLTDCKRMSLEDALAVGGTQDEIVFQVKDALAGRGYKEFHLRIKES